MKSPHMTTLFLAYSNVHYYTTTTTTKKKRKVSLTQVLDKVTVQNENMSGNNASLKVRGCLSD